jgi:hypothetical protein
MFLLRTCVDMLPRGRTSAQIGVGRQGRSVLLRAAFLKCWKLVLDSIPCDGVLNSKHVLYFRSLNCLTHHTVSLPSKSRRLLQSFPRLRPGKQRSMLWNSAGSQAACCLYLRAGFGSTVSRNSVCVMRLLLTTVHPILVRTLSNW